MLRFFVVICLMLRVNAFAFAQTEPVPDLMLQFRHLEDKIVLLREDHPDKSLPLCREQARIARLLGHDSLRIEAALNLASALSLLGFFELALKEALPALQLAKQTGRTILQQSLAEMIARCYQSLGDYPHSTQYFTMAKQAALRMNSFADTLGLNFELAFNRIGMGEEEAGLQQLKAYVHTALQSDDEEAILYGLDNLANALAHVGRYKEALSYQLQVLQYPESWNSNLQKTGVYDHLAEIYIKLDQWDPAGAYADSTFKYALLLNSNDWLLEAYKLRAMIAAHRHDYKAAYAAQQQQAAFRDSIFQQDYDTKIAAMTSFYDLENKQNRIDLLEKDNALKRIRHNQLLTGAALLLILLAAGFYLRNLKQKQALQRVFSRRLLHSQEQERQRIARELHDSVGQNILFVKNQLMRETEGQDRQQLLDTVSSAIEEVRNISKDLYPNQLEKFGLAASLQSLAEKIMEHSGLFISIDLADVEKKLNKDAVINLYRVFQECFSNILKHAGATAVRITAEQLGQQIRFTVQDNGKGFDKAAGQQQLHTASGILNIEERIRLLKGRSELHSRPGEGLRWVFLVPASTST